MKILKAQTVRVVSSGVAPNRVVQIVVKDPQNPNTEVIASEKGVAN